jgi:integrase
VISAIFKRAKQLNYFQGENPARDTGISPNAPEAEETYAYSLEEVQTILAVLPEPAATAFAVAAFMGLRHGEIQGLLWENYHDGELHITQSIWNGHATTPKTRKSSAPVPVIRQFAERLEIHRMRDGNPQSGPIFRNSLGKPLCLNNVLGRQILPALNRCTSCRESEDDHRRADHEFERDVRYPEWHGWHAARRGLGSNLYRLGIPDKVIQQILRHANVSTTSTYYIKAVADDVRKAMETLENNVPKPPLNFFRTATSLATASAAPIALRVSI